MKSTGFSCKIDKLGRIVIPKPIRKKYDMEIDDTLELFMEYEGIVLRKYTPSCIFCGSDDEVLNVMGKPVCGRCLDEVAKKSLERE